MLVNSLVAHCFGWIPTWSIPGRNASMSARDVWALYWTLNHLGCLNWGWPYLKEGVSLLQNCIYKYCLLKLVHSYLRRLWSVIMLLMWSTVILSRPVPPPTFLNSILNLWTFHGYVPTYLCFIFVQPCPSPICILHLTPRSLLPHDLMFRLNLSLVSFVFVHMSYPLVRYTDPDLIEIYFVV